MKANTYLILTLIVLISIAILGGYSRYETTFLDSVEVTGGGNQYHLVRTDKFSGEITSCVASFSETDEKPWASCRLGPNNGDQSQ